MPELTLEQKMKGIKKLGIDLPPEASEVMLEADRKAKKDVKDGIDNRRAEIVTRMKNAGISA